MVNVLQAVAYFGKQGGTVQEAKDRVKKRQEECMEKTSDHTITGLVGSGRTIQDELNKVCLALLLGLPSDFIILCNMDSEPSYNAQKCVHDSMQHVSTSCVCFKGYFAE